jgi:hypothetical protein
METYDFCAICGSRFPIIGNPELSIRNNLIGMED